jgi:hypothetical protein
MFVELSNKYLKLLLNNLIYGLLESEEKDGITLISRRKLSERAECMKASFYLLSGRVKLENEADEF